jgi:hypothetical protein
VSLVLGAGHADHGALHSRYGGIPNSRWARNDSTMTTDCTAVPGTVPMAPSSPARSTTSSLAEPLGVSTPLVRSCDLAWATRRSASILGGLRT